MSRKGKAGIDGKPKASDPQRSEGRERHATQSRMTFNEGMRSKLEFSGELAESEGPSPQSRS